MIFCAGRTELFEFAEPIGVGLVESAIKLTKKLTTATYEMLSSEETNKYKNLEHFIRATKSQGHSAEELLSNLLERRFMGKRILFIGSAGSYGNASIGEIHTSSKAYNVELSSLLKKSFTPIEDFVEIGNVPHGTSVNSSNYITSSKESSELFLSSGLEIENMEAFSFLSVAKEFGLDAEVVLIVTNYCYDDAHKEYLSNLKHSMKKLEEYVREIYR
jgi:nucleoside phosphorylase